MDADKPIAERALKALQSLNTSGRDHSLGQLNVIRMEMANSTPDHVRADAWLAVCALCEALAPEGERTSDIITLHREAMVKTERWLAAFG